MQAYLRNVLCQCSGAHSSMCLIHTSRLSLALMLRTLRSVSPANISLNFCGSMEQRLWNASRRCAEVNGNRRIHFIFQMHASSPSIQMWRDCAEANKVAGFNRTHQSSVSIDGAGCRLLKNGGRVVTMSQVFFGNKRISQIKIQDKVNGWKAKWASRDVLMLLLTSEIKSRTHFSSKQGSK